MISENLYTLILTLLVSGAQSPTISQIDGFKSEASCHAAGVKWSFDMVKVFGVAPKMSSVCVAK